MSQRAARSTFAAARPAGKSQLDHLGSRCVGEKPEGPDSGAEESDNRSPDGGGHVHDARIARDQRHGMPQHRPGTLQSEKTSRIDYPPRSSVGEEGPQGCIIGPAYDSQVEALRRETLDQRAPMLERPPLGRVCGARRQGDQGTVRNRIGSAEPVSGFLLGLGCQKEIRCFSVGLYLKITSRLEVALGHRSGITVEVPLGVDQNSSSHPMFGVPAPTPRHQGPEQSGADAIVEVQQMGVAIGSELGGNAGQAPLAGHTEHPAHVGIVADQWGVHLLGEHGNARRRMAAPDRTEEWSGQENVADGAESHGQHVRSGGSVVHGVKVQRER